MSDSARPRSRLVLATGLLAILTSARAEEDCHGPGADAYRRLVETVEHGAPGGAPVGGIEALILLLDNELRSNFTFVRESRSPHGALANPEVDSLHPRVILFREDARLVLAFTGNPTGAAWDTLEAIHFCDRERRFQPSRFILPASRRAPLHSNVPVPEIPDPLECNHCHGADPRPLFDAYPAWPGFYGSVEDRLIPGTAEHRAYRQFLAANQYAKSGVYRLLSYPAQTPVPPYFSDAAFGRSDDVRFNPNTRLGMALTELNRKRIARRIEASPGYSDHRYKVISGLLGCEPMPVTAADRIRVERALTMEDRVRVERLNARPGSKRAQAAAMEELTRVENMAEIDWLSRSAGAWGDEWSMAIEPGSLSLFDGILSSDAAGRRDFYFKEDLILELMGDLAKSDEALSRYFKTYAGYEGRKFGNRLVLDKAVAACPLLLERAKNEAWPVVGDSSVATSQWAIARCLPCHDGSNGNGDAPPLAFREPAKLPEVAKSSGRPLREEIEARVRPGAERPMPPTGTALTKTEVESLLQALFPARAAMK